MLAAAPEQDQPRVLSETPGRCRVHMPAWSGRGGQKLEASLRSVKGVRSAQANPLTRNVLVSYDDSQANSGHIVEFLSQVNGEDLGTREDPLVFPPSPVIKEKHGHVRRARVTVRGLDRDPHLGSRIVTHIEKKHGVRATASPLTGRVLVEATTHMLELENIIAEITAFELPTLPLEDHPHHPMDPLPLLQSSVRTIGAAIGVAVIVARRLMRHDQPFVPSPLPARIAGVIGLIQGFPFIRNTLRHLLGRTASDVVFYAPVMVSLAISESVLGLALTGIEAARLFTEVLSRRAAWTRYESRLGDAPSPHVGAVVRLESGQRTPMNAEIIEGTGVATGRDALPDPVAPGVIVSAGSRMYGGPFVVQLLGGQSFEPQPRDIPPRLTPFERYVQYSGLLSLGFGALHGFTGSSWSGFLEGLLLFNPRPAVVGTDFADTSAFSRVLRGDVTVVGTRANRHIRVPDLLLLEGPRLLTEGYELAQVIPLTRSYDASELLTFAAGVSVAAGSPWGSAFPVNSPLPGAVGDFSGFVANATCGDTTWAMGPVSEVGHLAGSGLLSDAAQRKLLAAQNAGNYPLLLCEYRGHASPRALALIVLRPRLAAGVEELVSVCQRHGVELAMLTQDDEQAAEAVATRAHVERLPLSDPLEIIADRQSRRDRVYYVSDNGSAAEAFAMCDLAIGLSSGRGSRFPARADLLAPDLGGIASIVEAGARHRSATQDSIWISIASNIFGIVWGLRSRPGVENASQGVYVAALTATAIGWWKQRGGQRARSILTHLADPRPERWGRRGVDSVLHLLRSHRHGLTSSEALSRLHHATPAAKSHPVLIALAEQFRSPLPAILMLAGGLALTLGATLDFVVIMGALGINLAVGAYQEVRADQASEALEKLSSPSALVLRDRQMVTLPSQEVVQGDVMLLAPGDRIAADGRLIEAHGLEVDEAILTGESLPVRKMAAHGSDSAHIVLEGSDVVAGNGRAVVVAVGKQTRLGATAAALALHETDQSPLGVRLSKLLQQLLPLAAGGGSLVFLSGLLRGNPLLPQLAVGASIALASVPEGLPLLAGMGEAAVANRLSKENALVRRLSSVEALGRVDVACTDKTGTLTAGRLALTVVACVREEVTLPAAALSANARHVLLTAGLACPHPDAADAKAHPTDVAVVTAAEAAGLHQEVRSPRGENAPFDPSRSYHGVVADGRVCIKGAPEVLIPWCSEVLDQEGERRLTDSDRATLLERTEELAGRGLRVLMVAEGSGHCSVTAPRDLCALGFVGIQDPLRESVPAAVQRCLQAGVRVVMLTGDHPVTARAIAFQAGLPMGEDTVLTGMDIAELEDEELDERLEHATVVARATPLDKLRIVDSLRRRGHTIAMTGDGVNDAPALRLADVGVAMGRAGTEVARQAADLVLTDDDFSTLVEALVEGRSFWRNMRRSLGLLLGGNLGELGMVVGASALGLGAPLTVRQILAVNLITDALPALSVVLQAPEHRKLSALSREGTNAIDFKLRRDVLRRGTATAVPAFGAFLMAMRGGDLVAAQSVAFGSIVATQLAQTLDAGRVEGSLTPPVIKAVGASAVILLSFLLAPPLQSVFSISMPAAGWGLTAAAAATAVVINRGLHWAEQRPAQLALPAATT